MIRKIIYGIISIAILTGGYFAIGKIRYWERSVAIFKMTSTKSLPGRVERSEFEGRRQFGNHEFVGPDRRTFPDSARQRFEAREGNQGVERGGMRELPDSVRRRFEDGRATRGGDRINRGDFRGGFTGREGFNNRKKINLRNVYWFVLVFASFTVLTLYLDKVYCYFQKKKICKELTD